MPHKIRWLVPKRVLLTNFYGVISSSELSSFMDEILVYAQKGDAPVHHISDSLALQRVEFSIATARALVKGRHFINALGWQVDVNRNAINRMFADIIGQIAGVRTRAVMTMRDAYTFLSETDASLQYVNWEMLLENDKEATVPIKGDL